MMFTFGTNLLTRFALSPLRLMLWLILLQLGCDGRVHPVLGHPRQLEHHRARVHPDQA
jgi:hypothetical protein